MSNMINAMSNLPLVLKLTIGLTRPLFLHTGGRILGKLYKYKTQQSAHVNFLLKNH